MIADSSIKWDEFGVFLVLFLGVVGVGFFAARWRRGDMRRLDEWGLGGRRFGTLVTWFLLGGDLYTAYTFIAVPASVYGALGAVGLYAIPYTVIVYPIVYVVMPKLWQVCRNKGYVTGADFVRDRFDSRLLALVIALTGLLATMPYIALQVFGISVVLAQMGIDNYDAAIVVAFVVLAIFTFVSGLRAPALIAVVKDVLIWITVIVAVTYIPWKLGGFGAVFHSRKVPPSKLTLTPGTAAAYSTLALGSALALFLYPHAITGTLASKSTRVIQRNAALLPAYSFLLGLIALLGYMALAAGVQPSQSFGANGAIPALFDLMFHGPFAGFAFAALAIGALVPAAVMSIAAANLFSRNVWREFIRPQCSTSEQTLVAKIASTVVKLGALVFVIALPNQQVINLQLAGGVWIAQTLPAIFLGLYFGWLDRWAVLAGWAAGMSLGTWALAHQGFNKVTQAFPLSGGNTVYIAVAALVLNLAVSLVGTVVVRAAGVRQTGRLTDADFLPQAANAVAS